MEISNQQKSKIIKKLAEIKKTSKQKKKTQYNLTLIVKKWEYALKLVDITKI